MEKPLKEYLNDGAEYYKTLSEWEQEKADNAPVGSRVKEEMSRNAKFNEGRSKAYLEVIELLEDYIG